MRSFPVLTLALAASGCGDEPEPSASEAARAVAMVERAQERHPPVEPMKPQAVTRADIGKAEFFGAGCGFAPDGQKEAVLYTGEARGLIKLEGELVVLAADSGSAEFPYGTREAYTGRSFELRLIKAPGEGAPASEESVWWPSQLTVLDQWDRVLYRASGSLECGGGMVRR